MCGVEFKNDLGEIVRPISMLEGDPGADQPGDQSKEEDDEYALLIKQMQDGIDQEPLPNIDKPILPFNPLIPFKQELIAPTNLPKV